MADELYATALLHHQAGRLDQAEQLYRQVLAISPRNADALHFLGVIAHQTDRNELAVELIGKAIAIDPKNSAYHTNLGSALRKLGRWEDSIRAIRSALTLSPGNPTAHNNLGITLQETGDLASATASFRRAIQCKPDFAKAHCNLALALLQQGDLSAAGQAIGQALSIAPALADVHVVHARVLRTQGNPSGAEVALRRAAQLNPRQAEAHSDLGDLLRELGRLDEAVEQVNKAIELAPRLAEANANRGAVLFALGLLDESISASRKAIELKPSLITAHSNLINTMLFSPAIEPQDIYLEARRWEQAHAARLSSSAQRNLRRLETEFASTPRRIRVGYVSPDLRDHAVARFLLPLLHHHDRQAFEIVAYADVPRPDAVTAELRRCVDSWIEAHTLSDEQLADKIRADEVDILVDLAGHTAQNRLLVFARRPAPVQVSYLGYPASTGLSAIDYRFTDALADPVGMTERFHSETLVRLSPCSWCYEPPASPPVAPRQSGPVVFGCFNHFAKVTGPMLQGWAQILNRAQDSRLIIKSRGVSAASAQRRVRELFASHHIDPARVELHDYSVSHAAHLQKIQQIDIALDTFPYHGTTTTCEALWMGLPVVSLAGTTHVSRVGVSLLNAVARQEFIADSIERYVQIAVDLANDPARLSHLRSTLRRRVQQSPLMDAHRLARGIEASYQQMWAQFCGKK